jgi:murein DD-endopeptidase MepM/ murein hydrolase activator NlpD
MSKYKHEKESPNRNLNIALGVIGSAIAVGVPLTTAGTAGAATDSQWDAVAIPEAGGNWAIDHSGDGLSVGGLQFQNPSWQDALKYLRSQGIDTSSFTPSLYQGMSNVPSKAQQILAGEALLHLQGPGAWANGNASGIGASMFDGGSVPKTVADSGLLAGTKWDTGSTPVTPKPVAPKPVATPSKPSTPSVPVSSGAQKYTTKAGDTLWGLAVKFYGEGNKYPHIFHANTPPLHSDPNSLPVGIELTIPKVVDSKPASSEKYTVKSGDTLYDITKVKIGDSSLDNWKPLYEENKKVIGSDPDVIFPGQVLTLPWSSESDEAIHDAPKPTTPKPSTPKPTTPAPSVSYVAPIDARVTQVYGNPRSGYTLGYHTGVDFTAPQGTSVKAVSNGTVVSSDTSSAYGINVQIRNADGTYSLYAHLSAKYVSPGDTVTVGQQVGAVGSTGTSTGPHLHFEIRTAPKFAAGNFLNPLTWLAGKGINL